MSALNRQHRSRFCYIRRPSIYLFKNQQKLFLTSSVALCLGVMIMGDIVREARRRARLDNILARMCRYVLDHQTRNDPRKVRPSDPALARSFSREGLTIDEVVNSCQQIRVLYLGTEVFKYVFEKPGIQKGHTESHSEGHWQAKVRMLYSTMELQNYYI